MDDLNKVIEAKPDLVDAYIERGIVFTQARRFDDALGDLNRAVELDAQNAKAYAMRASVKLQAAPSVTSNPEGNAQANDDALNDVNQALQLAANDPTALRIRGNVYEALNRTDEGIADYKQALAQDPLQTESRDALQRLGQEVPPEEGQPLGEEVAGWVIKEPQPGRYVASNEKYPALKAELEMYGAGQPKILEWKLLKDALTGIGLLKYYAGDFGDGQDSSLEYVAIVDTRANKVISVEPHTWGDAPAQWNWQAVSVVVTDPDGNKNEVQLRKVRQRAPARDDFWGFDRPDTPPADNRRAARRGGGTGRRRWRHVRLAVPLTLFLASVRDAEEAELALHAGADIVDLKDPDARGARRPSARHHRRLRQAGRRPRAGQRHHRRSAARRRRRSRRHTQDRLARRRLRQARHLPRRDAERCLKRLAGDTGKLRVILVLFADAMPDFDAVALAARIGAHGVMFDTMGKRAGSLPEHMSFMGLADRIAAAKAEGLIVGLAGSLQARHVPSLLALQPDLLGFRGALCHGGDRAMPLDSDRLAGIRALIPERPRIFHEPNVAERIPQALC